MGVLGGSGGNGGVRGSGGNGGVRGEWRGGGVSGVGGGVGVLGGRSPGTGPRADRPRADQTDHTIMRT